MVVATVARSSRFEVCSHRSLIGDVSRRLSIRQRDVGKRTDLVEVLAEVSLVQLRCAPGQSDFFTLDGLEHRREQFALEEFVEVVGVVAGLARDYSKVYPVVSVL